jgi:FkbH-like domain
MILKLKDFVSFKANWKPKSENIKAIANDLNLGLDSMVFIDDNPAEIEQVNQFVPDVKTICLFDDPTQFKIKLKNSIFFEPRSITKEDKRKTELYRTEEKRKKLKNQSIDLTDYLKTLDMKLEIIEFRNIDVSRISQLINKSNQFNLTTIRRNENDIKEMINSKNYIGFSFRLIDKFSDHGLIGVYILEKQKKDLIIDTFIMSCRVLERQVEKKIINSILNYADQNGV